MTLTSAGSSSNFAAIARDRLNGAFDALKSATASTSIDDGDENVDDSFTKPSSSSRSQPNGREATTDLEPEPSSSMESPVESEPPMPSVCGGAATDIAEGEATVQNLLRVLFGSCTSGVPDGTKSGKADSSRFSGMSPAKGSPRSPRPQRQEKEEDGDGAAEGGGRSGANSSKRSKKSQQGRRTSPSGRSPSRSKGDGTPRGRNRGRDVPLTQIETEIKDESFYANFYADDHARFKADGQKGAGESTPATPNRHNQLASTSSLKKSLEAHLEAQQTTTEELIRQAHNSPYRVSEVPRPPPAASMDEADAESFCYDDGISALSAHTLEEMAKANPLPRRAAKAVDPPVEEGFDITIELTSSAAVSATGKKSESTGESSPSSSPPVSSPTNTEGSDATDTATPNATSKKEQATGSITPLRSKSRRVVDNSADIHDVDESGDGISALPPSPAVVVRAQSSRTHSSRTTQTSASSNTTDFESAWRKDEAQYWQEEAKKEQSSINIIGSDAGGDGVDEDGFPIPSSAAAPITPTKIGLLTSKKQLSRSRSNDLTAPTAAMTSAHTICTGASTLASISPSRHPHETIPLDVSDCILSSTTSTASGSDKAMRRKSRRQRIHDGLVRRGLMMMKGGGYQLQEDSMSPTNEIFIRNDIEVGEI